MGKARDTKKRMILKALRREIMTTTEISALINWNYYQALALLADLKRDGKIELYKPKKITYWKLKDKSPIQRMEESK